MTIRNPEGVDRMKHELQELLKLRDARIAELEKQLRRAEELFQDECDPVSEPDSYAWLQDVRSLMESC